MIKKCACCGADMYFIKPLLEIKEKDFNWYKCMKCPHYGLFIERRKLCPVA